MVSSSLFYLACAIIIVAVANAEPGQKTFCFCTPFCLLTGQLCSACCKPGGTGSSGNIGGGTGGFSPNNPAQFNTATIAATNVKRQAECASPVLEDAALTAAAQAYANKMAASGVWAHSPEAMGGKYGENLAMQCGATMNQNTAVDGWYNEKRYYSKGSGIVVSGATMNGHYTALVWKSTTMAGCGVATGANKCTYVVCNYLAAGNNPATVATEVGC